MDVWTLVWLCNDTILSLTSFCIIVKMIHLLECHLFLLFCKFFDFFAPCCHQWIIIADTPSVPYVTFHFLLAVPGIKLSLCFLVKSLQKGFHPCKSAPCHFSPLSQTDVFAFCSVSRVLYLGPHAVDRYSFRPKIHSWSWAEVNMKLGGGSSDSSVAVFPLDVHSDSHRKDLSAHSPDGEEM